LKVRLALIVYNIIYIMYFYCYDYLCDELITRPEESYRLWCVVVCDLENLVNEEAMTRVGSQRHRKKNCYDFVFLLYVYVWLP